MKFRTEIELDRHCRPIEHSQRIMLLGSCFSDNIGLQLEADGFEVCHNPMGPLYNPVIIAKFILRLLDGEIFPENELQLNPDADDGIWHALDYPLRYSSSDKQALLQQINSGLCLSAHRLSQSDVVILTLGTAWYFEPDFCRIGAIGNCHKFQDRRFRRGLLTVREITSVLRKPLQRLIDLGKRVIVTVSPIRHLNNGLHGNQLSKAALLLAVEELMHPASEACAGDLDNCCTGPLPIEYFPAYEILLDDLRDYRFYAPDLKHPSDQAVEYIYGQFATQYFSKSTIALAQKCRAEYLRSRHRPLL